MDNLEQVAEFLVEMLEATEDIDDDAFYYFEAVHDEEDPGEFSEETMEVDNEEVPFSIVGDPLNEAYDSDETMPEGEDEDEGIEVEDPDFYLILDDDEVPDTEAEHDDDDEMFFLQQDIDHGEYSLTDSELKTVGNWYNWPDEEDFVDDDEQGTIGWE